MVFLSSFSSYLFVLLIFILANILQPSLSSHDCTPVYPSKGVPFTKDDNMYLQFPLNLEFLEAEFFLFGALGQGLDVIDPSLPNGGPPPIGARKANLDSLTLKLITEFAYQEVGHLRALRDLVGLFPRPLLNLSAENFASLMDDAFGYKLSPPFDPYRDSLSYLVASYIIPYVGLVGYVGTNPFLEGYRAKRLLAGLLGVEAGQDAVIRTLLYERATDFVKPYDIKVSDFTEKISALRDRLADCGHKDEGIIVSPAYGAENKTSSNVLSAHYYSIAYKRTASEILRIVYGSGKEMIPGGFFPNGGNGDIAKKLLQKKLP